MGIGEREALDMFLDQLLVKVGKKSRISLF
jgi:hypothetical protein